MIRLSENLRVCYIIPRLFPEKGGVIPGGCAVTCISLALQLIRWGVHVDLLTTIPAESEKFLAEHPIGRFVDALPIKGGSLMGTGLASVWALRRRLNKRMKQTPYHIVHCHSGAYPYAIIPSRTRRGTCSSLHSLYCPVADGGGVYSQWWERGAVVRPIFNRLDKVIAVTNNVRVSLEKVGIKPGHIEFVPMTVDTKQFQPTPYNGEPGYFPTGSKGARILFVGNASKEKGLMELVQALGILRQKGLSPYLVATVENLSAIPEYDARLKDVRKVIADLGMNDNVRIVGLVSQIKKLYAEADIVVIPWNSTRGPSDYPMVLLEAMAMGKCVIATPIGGCPELLIDAKAGKLTQGYTSQHIATAMESVMLQPDLRHAMGRAANVVAQRFSVETIAERMINLYEQLLSNSSPS